MVSDGTAWLVVGSTAGASPTPLMSASASVGRSRGDALIAAMGDGIIVAKDAARGGTVAAADDDATTIADDDEEEEEEEDAVGAAVTVDSSDGDVGGHAGAERRPNRNARARRANVALVKLSSVGDGGWAVAPAVPIARALEGDPEGVAGRGVPSLAGSARLGDNGDESTPAARVATPSRSLPRDD